MKKTFIFILNIYQILFSGILHQLVGVKNACRFEVSCSQYAKNMILKKGIFRGSYLSILRVLKCQPFYSI